MSAASTGSQADLTGFRESAHKALRDTFGWDEFRPGQLEVLEALHEHKAALALFPTGGGKSLCYQLYSQLSGGGLTIVVSPLIALMKDQVDDMLARGVAAARIDSSLELHELKSIRDQIRSGALRLLYVAPERFNNENFRALVEGADVSLFAVDEAHCISQWGHNFRPDYLKLVDFAERLEAKAVLALTATATPAVVDDICEALEIPAQAAILTSAYRPNLFIDIRPVGKDERIEKLIDRIRHNGSGTSIVYVTLQKTAEAVALALQEAGLPAQAYHAGLYGDRRVAVQEEWMQGNDRIVVATIAFGMGIDKSDVRAIYHYNLPKSLESYVQEIGRAGRDGKPSRVELLGNRDDLPQLASFTLGDTPSRDDVHRLIEHLFGKEEGFSISLARLARAFDIRQLTLATLLTYLENEGVIIQETPQYGSYQITPKGGEIRLLNSVKPTVRAWYKELFAASQVGRKHITTDLAIASAKTGRDREELLKGIQFLENEGFADLQPKMLLKVFKLVATDETPDTLTAMLMKRFESRELADLARLDQVVEFVEIQACKTAYLLRYFGEENPTDCGHCAYCEDNSRDFTAAAAVQEYDIDALLTDALKPKFLTLRQKHGKALSDPRKAARFLLGINSPAVTAARIGRNPFQGMLEGFPYAKVFEYVEAL